MVGISHYLGYYRGPIVYDRLWRVPGPFTLIHVRPGSVRPKSDSVRPDNYNLYIDNRILKINEV
jgi:hypothetical protein